MNEQHKRYSDIIKKVLDPTGQRTAKVCLTPYMYDKALWERMERITEAYANLLEFVFKLCSIIFFIRPSFQSLKLYSIFP